MRRLVIKQPIEFIGLGNMGLPMATNLVDAGARLRVCNPIAQKAQPQVKKRAKLAAVVKDRN